MQEWKIKVIEEERVVCEPFKSEFATGTFGLSLLIRDYNGKCHTFVFKDISAMTCENLIRLLGQVGVPNDHIDSIIKDTASALTVVEYYDSSLKVNREKRNNVREQFIKSIRI